MAPRKGYVRKYSTKVRTAGITVHRKGKTYKVYPKSKPTIVRGRCVKSASKSKRGPARFGPLKKGELTRLGYSSRLSEEERRRALKMAVGVYGALGVYRKLDAVAKLTVRTIPSASVVYAKDRSWIRATFGPLKAEIS